MTVGDYDTSTAYGPAAETWTRNTWYLDFPPAPTSYYPRLFGVSCVTFRACMAVSWDFGERWDGTAWSPQSVATPANGGVELQSVSCRSADACQAVGLYGNESASYTLAESWNGSMWSVEPTPNAGAPVAGGVYNSLGGVSCGSSTTCEAVGDANSSTGPLTVAAEGWDGTTWSLQTIPVLSSSGANSLAAVSCSSASWCVAVGQSTSAIDNQVSQPLAYVYENGATPALEAGASANVVIGGQIHDVATLSGGNAPRGKLTFSAYGPDDGTCTGTPAFTSQVRVNGNGRYDSGSFTPTSTGEYYYTVGYSGDGHNEPAVSGCDAAGSDVLVVKASPSMSIAASGKVALGGQVQAAAGLTGGDAPGGQITFSFYGPECKTLYSTDTVPVSGDATYDSGAFTPPTPGYYRIVAGYSGDQNNYPVTTGCFANGSEVTVTGLQTTASPGINLGGRVHDSAALFGQSPTGTITFKLYGPNDTTCSNAPVFQSTVTIGGNGKYSSSLFMPAAAGTYQFTASYSGDANNSPMSEPCGAAGEQVVVS